MHSLEAYWPASAARSAKARTFAGKSDRLHTTVSCIYTPYPPFVLANTLRITSGKGPCCLSRGGIGARVCTVVPTSLGTPSRGAPLRRCSESSEPF